MMRHENSMGFPHCPYCDSLDYDIVRHETDDDGDYKVEMFVCVCESCHREYTNEEYWSMNDHRTFDDKDEEVEG